MDMQRQVPADFFPEIAQGLAAVLGEFQDRPGIFLEDESGFGRNHAVGVPAQQLMADLTFQILQAPAHGRFGQAEFPCRCGLAAVPDDGIEDIECFQVIHRLARLRRLSWRADPHA